MVAKTFRNSKGYIVSKRNDLNELSPRGMSLQQLRFIVIYLGMINPKDENTRLVRFSLAEFQAIMEMGRLNIKQLKDSVDDLLSKVTGTITETGGILRFQYFKRCLIDTDDNGEWYIEIDANDDALPLFFDLKSNYFKYQLWNGLRLKSINQLRFYEILKQYQWRGVHVFSVKNLKNLLGIDENEYTKFYDFKRCVLDVCQKALSENTDICFKYEPHGKKGRGGKILELKFNITKNTKFQDPLALEKFTDIQFKNTIENISDKKSREDNLPKLPGYREESDRDTLLTETEHAANFELFWEAYPENKRAGILLAKEEWGKLPRTKILFKEIMEGLEKAKKSNKWTTDRGIYIHEPANWIKQERWRDNYDDSTKIQKGRNNKKSYEGRKWDYNELARLEGEYLDKKLAE